jgi:cytoskeleton protein RodZ
MVQRRGNLFGDGQDSGDDRTGVGSLLKRRREELQQDIEDISRQLRIRSVYVLAIEEGRFQELPGNAYAVGFVRAYADYLGLDGASIVGDYREELARRSRQNNLVWPSEGSESRFPGGAILVVCVLLGLVIYGGWYYAAQSGGTGIKLIDQVPEYIKKATGVGQVANQAAPVNAPPGSAPAQAGVAPEGVAPEGVAPKGVANAPVAGAAIPPAATNDAQASQNAPAGATPPQPPPIPPSAAAAAVPPASTPAPAQTQNGAAPPPAVVATPTTNAPAAVTLGQEAPAPAASVDNVPAPPAPDTANAAPAAAPPATPANTQAAVANGQSASGQSTGEQAAALPPAAKIVIRANRDSWIEVRDQNDDVIFQKVLRQGESYNVPDQKGLIMTTGNAGGIVIELEGKPLQSVGSLGVVKRGIKLDPVALANGSAFNSDDY